MAGYSGDTEVRPQSSQRRYRTGSASERPMTRALGTPQRGQTIPEVERLAIGLLLTPLFRLRPRLERYTNYLARLTYFDVFRCLHAFLLVNL